MSTQTTRKERKEKTTLFLGITLYDLIGLAIMLGFRFIPAPAPLTQTGMQVLGTLLGIVFIFSAVGSTWGVFLAWLSLAEPAVALGVKGNSPIYAVGTISFGDWLTIFIILSCLLCHALKTSGFMAHFSHWFLNTNLARKSPWHFLFAWMLLSFILGFFIETITVCVFLLPVAYSIFERVGYKPGDKFPGCVVIGTVLGALCSYVCTPIGYGAGYKGMALAVDMMDGNLHMIEYMLLSFPGAIAAFVAMFLIFKYVVKPDVSNMEGSNYEAIIGEKPAPLGKAGLYTVIIYVAVLFFWVAPGFFEMFAPEAAITVWMNSMTSTDFAMIGLVLMCLIKVDGKPLLNLKDGLAKLPWGMVFVMATTRAIATCLGKPGTGFNDWIGSILGNFTSMNAWVMMAVICLILAVSTQFASNAPITALGIASIVPQAVAMGLNPVVAAVMLTNAAGLAMTLPSGFAFLGYLAGDEWNMKAPQLGIGTACFMINLLFNVVFIYFIGGAIF